MKSKRARGTREETLKRGSVEKKESSLLSRPLARLASLAQITHFLRCLRFTDPSYTYAINTIRYLG